jgi:hypothetical protein
VIRLVDYAAEQEGKTVNLLRQLLHDYAVSVRMRTTEEMDEELADVIEAMFYPDKPTGLLTLTPVSGQAADDSFSPLSEIAQLIKWESPATTTTTPSLLATASHYLRG